jgi:hypothetical protein
VVQTTYAPIEDVRMLHYSMRIAVIYSILKLFWTSDYYSFNSKIKTQRFGDDPALILR